MKKLMILLAVACLICVSCGGPKVDKVTEVVAEETCCTLTPEQEAMFANWEAWADLDATQQAVLVGEMKAFIDECKAKCEAECAEKCKTECTAECAEKCKTECAEAKEGCPEKAAKCAEFKAKWDNFETLALEEQKAILDEVLACQKAKCCKDKAEGCCKEKAEGCCKEGEEACQHNHENCDKQ